MNKRLEALQRAVKIAGGQKALASKLGLQQSYVWNWLNTGRKQVPGEFVLAIEEVTGVSKHDLRPDIFGSHPPTSAPAHHKREATV